MTLLRIPVLGLAVLLAACASAPPKRINPPQVAIQRLVTAADGAFEVELRLENQSDVAMRFASFDLAFRVAGIDAGRLAASPDLEVAAHSAEIVQLKLASTKAGEPLAAAQTSDNLPDKVLDGEFEYETRDGKMVKVPIDATRRAEIEQTLVKSDTAVHYQLRGMVYISEPKREYDIAFESRLSPVPGLPGEFR